MPKPQISRARALVAGIDEKVAKPLASSRRRLVRFDGKDVKDSEDLSRLVATPVGKSRVVSSASGEETRK